ncbi:poly(A) polymerase [Streptomyces sp. NPDC048606]|uniref:poly(A) polymerase n=1 Tax=Streptomyces sp. NPDC048606 TaxID=3154726 RepID=UPI003449CBD2
MRTSEQLYHQVRWDPRFDPARFTLGLRRRGAGPERVPLPSFVPGGDIPWHRVLFVEADGELVWDRASGLDRVDATSAGRVRARRLLRAPFFTAATPHAWDPSGRGDWLPLGPVPAPAAPPARVRLLTWNTLWDRYDAPLIATARRRPMLLDALAAADADVIALQEVEPALLTMLLAAPWIRADYTLGTDPRGTGVADSGLVILSRLPVREAGWHRLARHKAVTAVTVDTAAGPLVVAATHLSSDHTTNGAALRGVQLARIRDGLGALGAAGDVGLALLGDFNDGRGDTAGPAAALGLRDAWNEAHGAADETPTFDPRVNPLAAVGSLTGRAARLDRILLGSGAGARVDTAALRGDSPGPDGLFVSDHFAVEATVSFGEPPEAPERAARLDAAPTARTAVAWLPPEDPVVTRLRAEHDPAAGRWPAHVNLLFGFVPESSFEEALPLLAEVAAGTAPFPVRLEGVHSFGHREEATLWWDPTAGAGGGTPWRELRRALVERFPGCAGRAGEWTPHLTLGRVRDPLRAEREFAARLAGGRAARVGSLAVLARRGDGQMRVRATVELGTGVVRRVREEAPVGAPAATAAPDPREERTAEEVTARIAAALPGAVVRTVGSRAMGCASAGADLDLVAVVPGGVVDAGALRRALARALPDASRLREVTGARVPGVRLRVSGLDVDLVLVAADDADAHGEPDGPAAVALAAVGDAQAVRAAVGAEHPAFARLAREVKAWARARGLDGAPFGGLPGLAWAVLAARTVREAGPGADPETSAALLRREFFGSWAAWDWTVPVALPGAPEPVGKAREAEPAPVTVLTPAAPVRGCTAQVGPGTRDLLVRELYRAWELLEEDPEDFGRVLAAEAPHRRHAAWAVLTVRGGAPGAFEENLGRARGRLRALLGALADAGIEDAHAWPRPFERTDTLARYAVGLGAFPPDAARLAALAGPWAAGLSGVEVTRAACGEVPDLP